MAASSAFTPAPAAPSGAAGPPAQSAASAASASVAGSVADVKLPESLLAFLRAVPDQKGDGGPAYLETRAAGYTLRAGGQTRAVPSATVRTGSYSLPKSRVPAADVLDLSVFLFPAEHPHVFDAAYAEATLTHRVCKFIAAPGRGRFDRLLAAKYLIPAINLSKQSKKRDLPNVNAILTAFLLHYKDAAKGDVQFLDFLSYSDAAQTDVKIWNVSELVRFVRASPLAYTKPLAFADAERSFINYTRGTGVPDAKTASTLKATVLHAGGVDPAVMQVQLTPGKWTAGGVSQLCYTEFDASVAQTVLSFSDFPVYLQMTGRPALGRIFLLLDEFTGYAIALAAIVKAYGLNKHGVALLAYHGGTYTACPLYPWADPSPRV
jgi:hypothetical protein